MPEAGVPGAVPRSTQPGLLKIVNDHFLADRFENFLDELQMQRVLLVVVLRFIAVEDNVERHLLGLVHHRPMAPGHLADMKMNNARERRQKFPGSGDQFVRGLRIGRVGPENHDVRKHGRSLSTPLHKYNYVCGVKGIRRVRGEGLSALLDEVTRGNVHHSMAQGRLDAVPV